nr:hypothetical protein [Tanacetum cinerariifolium]
MKERANENKGKGQLGLGAGSHGVVGRGVWHCSGLDDTWSWVAMGAERQPDAATGAPEAAEPPPPPPAPTRAMPQRMARLEEDIHEIREALAEQHE